MNPVITNKNGWSQAVRYNRARLHINLSHIFNHRGRYIPLTIEVKPQTKSDNKLRREALIDPTQAWKIPHPAKKTLEKAAVSIISN
jgi:hypothetical protein